MTSPITTIIFDFGNVFVKWGARNLYKRFFPTLQAVDSFLEEIHFTEWNSCQDAGRPFSEGVVELSKRFPQYTELVKAYDIYWEESLTEIIHETIEIAQNLKRAGWSLYLLSNFSVEKFEIVKERHDFLHIFDEMIISGEHKLIKPDRAIFDLMLNKIKRNADECLFIDDSLPNIETARTMGFSTIHYQSPIQLKQELHLLSIKDY